jgi:hypothetical protein
MTWQVNKKYFHKFYSTGPVGQPTATPGCQSEWLEAQT